jgi:hypothetical protein
MQPHERVAALPIDLEIDRFPDFRKSRWGRGYMDHTVQHVSLAGIHYRDAFSTATNEISRIAWLTATQGVEDGSVQLKTPFMYGNHAGCGCLEVRIVAE